MRGHGVEYHTETPRRTSGTCTRGPFTRRARRRRLQGELPSLRDLNIGNAQYFDSQPQSKIAVIRSDKKRDEHGELVGESYIIAGLKTKCIKAFLKQDWPGIQWKKIDSFAVF